MNKKKLYEDIVSRVSASLKRTLNEDFAFDDTEIADKILELVKRDKQIQNITANANEQDWKTVLSGIRKIIASGKIPENPVKIANIVQLATAIINRGLDSKLQEKFKEISNEDLVYAANFLAKEIKTAYGQKKDFKPEEGKELQDSKNEGKGCSEGECDNKKDDKDNKDNKSVSEARNWKRQGGFSKFLNEQRRFRK